MSEYKSSPRPSSNTSDSTLASLSVDELLGKVKVLMEGSSPPELNSEELSSHVDALCYKVFHGNIESGSAFDFLRDIAGKGSSRAQRFMGDCCAVEVSKIEETYVREIESYARSLEWYKKAAAQGDSKAIEGVRVFEGLVSKEVTTPAYSDLWLWLYPMRGKGNSRASWLFDELYIFMSLYNKALNNANSWADRADDRQVARYNYQVANHYEKGLGVEKNLVLAYEFYKKAADLGNREATQKLKDLKEFSPAAQSEKEVKLVLSKLITRDEKNKERQFDLGFCYENGIGVDKDVKTAAHWYRLSAQQGHAEAQYHLGCCYEKGIGVKANLISALEWYQKAAHQKNPYAQKKLELPQFKKLKVTNSGGTYWSQSFLVSSGKGQGLDPKEQPKNPTHSQDLYSHMSKGDF